MVFPEIINIPITKAEISCSGSSFKNKNSSGCGGLSNKILDICGDYISRPRAHILRMSLTLGIYVWTTSSTPSSNCFSYRVKDNLKYHIIDPFLY
jgi:hypothetical protein